jgi:hypothetical protein
MLRGLGRLGLSWRFDFKWLDELSEEVDQLRACFTQIEIDDPENLREA